jgi:D-sedoheptulose 7-phosphate isomerase
MNLKNFANQYLDDLRPVLEKFDVDVFASIANQLLKAYHNENHIFVMGNGGSGATASHLTCDINKGCCFDLEKKFKMICLNDNIPTLLALANDVSYDVVFVEPLKNFFKPGDLVIGISGSGNSENVLQAIRFANANDGPTIGLSGYAGGHLAQLVDIAFVAPSNDMQKIEDVHTIVTHMLMQALYRSLHPTVDA